MTASQAESDCDRKLMWTTWCDRFGDIALRGRAGLLFVVTYRVYAQLLDFSRNMSTVSLSALSCYVILVSVDVWLNLWRSFRFVQSCWRRSAFATWSSPYQAPLTRQDFRCCHLHGCCLSLIYGSRTSLLTSLVPVFLCCSVSSPLSNCNHAISLRVEIFSGQLA